MLCPWLSPLHPVVGTMPLYDLTIHKAAALLNRREITSVELTRAVIERILSVENSTRAYLTLALDSALEEARLADQRRSISNGVSEATSPLLGIPLAIKDVICLAGLPTTAGSRMLEEFVPPYDATVVTRLRSAGAVFLGKTNTDEFAMGSSTENSAFFATRNPWDLTRVPGGSSGGSAAAVCAGEALGALGSDTGGSVRQPAAFCGVVGLKPTYGRVSRYGLVAFASSLDQVGPIAKDVTDCAILLNAIAGHDPLDSTTLDSPVANYAALLDRGVQGLRVGLLREQLRLVPSPEVVAAVERAAQVLEQLGAVVEEATLPHAEYALPAYYLLAPAEASANLARYDGVRYGMRSPENDSFWATSRQTRQQGFGSEVKRRIMLGTYALSAGFYDAYYVKAQRARTAIKDDFDRAFQRFDVLAGPTTPTVAFGLGERLADPLQMYLSDIFTLSQNLAGVCAVSVPCGFVPDASSVELPVGLQITGPALGEERILRVAFAFEQATGWHQRTPIIQEEHGS